MTQIWLRLLSRSPLAGLCLFVALTAAVAAQLWDFRAGEPRLRVETAINNVLPDGDDERRFYDRFRERFGNDEVVLLVLIAEDVLTRENLGRIRRITERIEALDGVRRVVSVANALDVRASEDGIRVEAFLEQMPESRASSRPYVRGSSAIPSTRAAWSRWTGGRACCSCTRKR